MRKHIPYVQSLGLTKLWLIKLWLAKRRFAKNSSAKILGIRGLVFLMVINLLGCQAPTRTVSPANNASTHSSKVNLQHFYHLYQEIEIDDREMAVVNIYSTYPDYAFAIEPREGFACVDDVARAIIMLSEVLKKQANDEVMAKLKKLIEFVLYMQNDNGYFNNFIWGDLSINTQYKTSRAELGWWSFRALWSLQHARDLIPQDPSLVRRMDAASERLVANLKRDLPSNSRTVEATNTLQLPTWLPHQYAADQAAIAVIGLLPYYQRVADKQVLSLIHSLVDGIIKMQQGQADQYPYGMFLSWKNLWHAWGNNQAYALLLAGRQLQRQDYIEHALLEVDHFYPYLLDKGFAESIRIEAEGEGFKQGDTRRFPHIAYGIRPMVYAASEAFDITGDEKYKILVSRLKHWFFGENSAQAVMYDARTGRTFDGIISKQKINLDAGAESTIEGLLVLLK